MGAGRDFSVITNPDPGLLAPDVRPPRARWGRAQDGALFGEGLVTGGLWGSAQFAMDFMLVSMCEQLFEQGIGATQFEDLVGGQEWGQAFLPVVVAAFDFAFGLGGGGVAQGDAVEVEGGAQLGEGIWVVGIEEGVVVPVEGQGQAVGLESTGEEIEVGQECFAGVEAGPACQSGRATKRGGWRRIARAHRSRGLASV